MEREYRLLSGLAEFFISNGASKSGLLDACIKGLVGGRKKTFESGLVPNLDTGLLSKLLGPVKVDEKLECHGAGGDTDNGEDSGS